MKSPVVKRSIVIAGHKTSVSLEDAFWKGLKEIAKVYEEMAEGRADKAFYVSSLPTGMGKTTIAKQSTKALLADSEFKNVGVIYFLARLEEIESLVKDMDLKPDEFAVWTHRDELNALGNPVREEARVLFTTQKRLEGYSKGGTHFAAMKELRHKGKPRQVRVWDEAILPALELTADMDGLYGLLHGLSKISDDLRDTIKRFADTLEDHVDEFITMPDIDEDKGELFGFVGLFAEDWQRKAAEALWHLSGHVVRVRRVGKRGVTLGYEDILPADLAPMLILDASADLRETYRFWEDHRRTLVRLNSPKKSYAGLTIHHWEMPSGSHWFNLRDKRKAVANAKQIGAIADGVVKMLAEIPDDEDVLVVTHKWETYRDRQTGKEKAKQGTLPALIEARRDQGARRVEFINYGRHTATNAFQDFKHVILAGLLQYNDATYEAMGRGAKRASVEDEFDSKDLKAMRITEISHHTRQAVGRGATRKTINGGCPEGCHLYTIFSTRGRGGFHTKELLTIFPDATLVDWKPKGESERRLTGKVLKAVEEIRSAVQSGRSITTTEVRNKLQMDRSNFRNDVVEHIDFKWFIEQERVGYKQEPGRPGVFFG